MPKMDAEKNAYGALERFLYIFLLPVLFTLVLVGVLLTLFDYDVKGTLYEVGRKIPVVRAIVPEDEEKPFVNPASASLLLEEQIAALEEELAVRDAELLQLRAELAEQEQAFRLLEDNVEQLVLSQELAGLDLEDTRNQLKSLAAMYTGMSASRAASILDRMSLEQLVLILYEMRTEDRGNILGRMDPVKAAEASIQLKDMNENNWAEYERRARESGDGQAEASSNGLTDNELAATFAAMAPDSAATILLELKKQNSKKAVAIVRAMTEQARSGVLAAIASQSPEDAAAFTDDLGGQ